MELKEFIEKQMSNHRHYANSFQKAPSISNEHYHPKTGNRLGWNEMSSLIDEDAKKRANAIIKRLKENIPQILKEENFFVAERNNKKLIVSENMLQQSKMIILVDKLNAEGFSLGSGHDGLEIQKKLNNDEVYYQFILTPFVGCMEQYIAFYKLKI